MLHFLWRRIFFCHQSPGLAVLTSHSSFRDFRLIFPDLKSVEAEFFVFN